MGSNILLTLLLAVEYLLSSVPSWSPLVERVKTCDRLAPVDFLALITSETVGKIIFSAVAEIKKVKWTEEMRERQGINGMRWKRKRRKNTVMNRSKMTENPYESNLSDNL